MKMFIIKAVHLFTNCTNLLPKLHFYVIAKLLKIKYDSFPQVSGYIFISGTGKIKLGKMVKLSSGRRSNPLGGETKLSIIASKGSILTIGNNCGISNSIIFCTNSITIEDNVLIGNGCKIYDTDFHPISAIDRENNVKPISKPILIKKNAFIGAHSIILKGVIIGPNAVVGAGSVVTKHIPENEVWAGNPAKFIKKISSLY